MLILCDKVHQSNAVINLVRMRSCSQGRMARAWTAGVASNLFFPCVFKHSRSLMASGVTFYTATNATQASSTVLLWDRTHPECERTSLCVCCTSGVFSAVASLSQTSARFIPQLHLCQQETNTSATTPNTAAIKSIKWREKSSSSLCPVGALATSRVVFLPATRTLSATFKCY